MYHGASEGSRGISELFQRVLGAFLECSREFQWGLWGFRRFQRLYRGVLEGFKGLQGHFREFKDFQEHSMVFQGCFRSGSGFSGMSRAFQRIYA